MSVLANPAVRLFLRALLVGITTFVVSYYGLGGTGVGGGAATLSGCVTAAILAFCEVFTPLNQLVGAFKAKKK